MKEKQKKAERDFALEANKDAEIKELEEKQDFQRKQKSYASDLLKDIETKVLK